MRHSRWVLGCVCFGIAAAHAQPEENRESDTAWKKAYLLSRAGDAYGAGKFDAAENLFKSVLKIDPEDETALLHLAAMALKREDRADALPYLTVAANSHPRSFAAQHELGSLLMALRAPGQALPYLSAAVKLRADSVDARVNYGDALALLGRRAEAVKAYEAALDIDPHSAWAHRQLGYSLFDLGKASEAIDHLELAAKHFDKEWNLFLVLGHAQNQQGNDSGSLAAYERVIKLKPELNVGYLFKGNVLARIGQTGSAEEAYQKAIQLQPRDPLAHVHLGNLHRNHGDSDRARREYEVALKSQPHYVWALVQLGFLMLEEGRHQEAWKYLSLAFKLSPDNPDLSIALGDLYLIQDRPGEAEHYYQRALLSRPNYLAAEVKLGDALQRQGKLQQALTHYRAAASAHPKSAWALIVLGDCERSLGLMDSAQGRYLAALKVDPGSSWAQRQLGFLFFDLGRDAQAKELLTPLAETLAAEVDIQLTLGHIARKQGDYPTAQRYYQRAAAVSPKHARARLFLGEIGRLQGDLSSAMAGYREAIDLDPKLLDAWVLQGDAARILALRIAEKEPTSPEVRENLILARSSYEKGMALDPTAPWPKRQLGLVDYELQNYQRSESLLSAVVNSYPQDPELPLTLGHLALKAGRLDQALASFERARTLAPADSRPRIALGQLLIKLGKPQRAVAELSQAALFSPRSGPVWLELGFAQQAVRDFNSAETSANRAVQFDPGSREAWLFLGRIRHRQNRASLAVDAYRQALKLSPQYSPAHQGLASALLSRNRPGDLDEARHEITVALASSDNESFPHLLAGQILLRIAKRRARAQGEELDEARHHFSRALELSPSDPATRVSAAQGFFELKEYGQSRKAIAPLIEEDEKQCPESEAQVQAHPTERAATSVVSDAPEGVAALDRAQIASRAHVLSGDLHLLNKADVLARREYGCAIALWPENAEAHLRLGLAYENAGLMDLAETHYLAALNTETTTGAVRAALERVRREGGYPVGRLLLSGEIAFRSEPVPPEIIARQAVVLGATSFSDRRHLLTLPRTLTIESAASYVDTQKLNIPRIQLRYDYSVGYDTFLNDGLNFENTSTHALTLLASGTIPKLNSATRAWSYLAGYQFSFTDASSRNELRHFAWFGGRLVQIRSGSIDAQIGFEHADFTLKQSASGDDASNSGVLRVRLVPALRALSMEGSFSYFGQAYWLSPSARQIWTHAFEMELLKHLDRVRLGGDFRAGVTSDHQVGTDAPNPTVCSASLAAKGGYAWTGKSWILGRVGISHVWWHPQFDAFTAGIQGAHRIFWPRWGQTDNGLTLSASYEVRYSYHLARVDHVITAVLTLAR